MLRIILLFVILPACLTQDLLSQQPRACRSVHLWWQDENQRSPEASVFYNEMIVDRSIPGSYFMACGFSKGYFGIQELTNGKKVALFSVWEPGGQDNPEATPEDRRVKTIASGDGVRVRRFGGEGTGGQSFFDFDWQPGELVRFAVFAKPEDEQRTQYAGFIYVPDENRWQHMATFSTLSDGHQLRGFYSFVEDFLRNGKSATEIHRARFGNGWIRTTGANPQWKPLVHARFTADRTPTENVDAGLDHELLFLQTGGDTVNENTELGQPILTDPMDRKRPLDLPQPFSEDKVANPIRILAYNIKHGRGNDGQVDLRRTASVIRRLHPDVVALQEVDHLVQRSGAVAQTRELARLTGLPHESFGKFFDYQGGEYGMGILSRFPLVRTKNLPLPEGAEPRSALLAVMDTPNGTLRLANVHFYRTESERMAQATELLRELNSSPKQPTVIAGDFNSLPSSSVLDLFQDWSIPDKGEDHFTFSSSQPDREIDFLMFRPDSGFELLEIDVVHEPVASDHRPVTMDVLLDPGRNESSPSNH